MKPCSMRSLSRLALAAGLMLGWTGPGLGQDQGFYFNASLGGSFAEDVTVKEFGGPVTGTQVKLDPGVHLGVAGGFNFARFVGVEAETGLLANTIDKLGNSSPDATLSHIPFLGNLIFRYDAENFPLVPYIGGGAGMDTSVFTIDHSLGLDGSDADVEFAYQAMAGLRYRINDKMSAGLGYKFYHADSASWDIQHSAGRIRFGEARVHCVSAVFNWKF
ncbi:MAG TPA: outer membrane beta-barrel protein [Candidatus Saccharimonadales bacterium]|jgi:opacity protein-like surface antigen|nr:outer membrane beta-barrel protein [Candidatus Saccharimonadales bacterium]